MCKKVTGKSFPLLFLFLLELEISCLIGYYFFFLSFVAVIVTNDVFF